MKQRELLRDYNREAHALDSTYFRTTANHFTAGRRVLTDRDPGWGAADVPAGKVRHDLHGNFIPDYYATKDDLTRTLALVNNAYKPGGSLPFAQLPAPSAATLGYLYTVVDSFVTTDLFTEGAGKAYEEGSEVAVVQRGGSYYYNVLRAGSSLQLNLTTVNSIVSQDDGFRVFYGSDDSPTELTLPLVGSDYITVDVLPENDKIVLKLSEGMVSTLASVAWELDLLTTGVTEVATQGTLSESTFNKLLSNDANYIVFGSDIYRLSDKANDVQGYRVYTHIGYNNAGHYYAKFITFTNSTRSWVLTTKELMFAE